MSGGAFLPKNITTQMNDIGILVLQGYGLTEYSPVASFERPDLNKPDSIGLTLYNMDVRIDNPDKDGNGELLVKGPSMMKGYYKKPDWTKKVIDRERWLQT